MFSGNELANSIRGVVFKWIGIALVSVGIIILIVEEGWI